MSNALLVSSFVSLLYTFVCDFTASPSIKLTHYNNTYYHLYSSYTSKLSIDRTETAELPRGNFKFQLEVS